MSEANTPAQAKRGRRGTGARHGATPAHDTDADTKTDVGRSLGPMIRRSRKRKELTLQQLADRADLSVSYISQIERNLLTPTVASLKRIAAALDIPAGQLMFAEAGSAKSLVAVLRKGHRKHVRFPQSSISYELLTPDLRRRVSALWLVANPGAEGGPALTHEGEDMVIVLQGQLSVDVAGTWHDLKAGDSIYFNSELSHRWCNRRKQVAQAIWISSPPYF
ncbi:MAG TPA: cupin domain-containing protein [Casimicrobiaceae bacterium]|nr:cupin domain-containing protein [Casimicrobiaceae bacterium]